MTMLAKLEEIEDCLPDLLREDASEWYSLNITYHKPYVERVWRQVDDVRVFLHRIYACKRDEALWHPHDWPSAMKVVSGQYEMGLALAGMTQSPITTCLFTTGSHYEMNGPAIGWHYVRPIGGPALSLMVAGKPWPKHQRTPFPKPDVLQEPLSEETKNEILFRFRDYYL